MLYQLSYTRINVMDYTPNIKFLQVQKDSSQPLKSAKAGKRSALHCFNKITIHRDLYNFTEFSVNQVALKSCIYKGLGDFLKKFNTAQNKKMVAVTRFELVTLRV